MMKLFGSTALVTIFATLLPAQVHAQEQTEAAEDTGGIAEIVVTAQKRAENVQQVPIAISAFTASSLKERAVGDVSSLANISPNVSLDAGTPFSGSTSVLSAYIRGIGQNDFAANLDPGVGVYLDGVYLARTVGANLDLPDVERVEILKGPQGTLFGRNTIGGAISIVTRNPGKQLSFSGDITTGRYNRLDLRGTANVPISETLGASLTFSTKDRDGFQKRVDYPGAGRFVNDVDQAFRSNYYQGANSNGGANEWTVRSKLRWEASSRLRLTISGDYLRQDQAATANNVLAVTADDPGPFAPTADRALVIPGLGATALYDASSGLAPNGFNFAGLYNFCIGSTASEIAARNATALCGSRGTPLNPGQQLGGLASVNVDGNPNNDRLPIDNRWVTTDPDKTFATGNSYSKMKNWGIAGTIDFDLGNNLALKSITSYRKIDWSSGLDADNAPIRILEFAFSLRQWQFSQELQLTGQAFSNQLKYVLGAYYFKENNDLNDFVTFDQGLLQIAGPNKLKTRNYAFFGQIDYRLNDLIGITVGGRYTHEDKSINGGQSDLNGFNYKLFNCPVFGDPCTSALGFTNPQQPLRYYVTPTQNKSFSNFAPKIGMQLHPSDNLMAYGSFARGYKTGGWTTRLSNPLPYAPSFDPEKAESFEIGVKSTLFDRRLQINAAAFTTRFKGIQLNFQQGVSPTIQNAGTARIKGFEIELTAAPTRSFSVVSSVGYTDAYYTDVLPQAVVAPGPHQAGTAVGVTLPKTPKWKFNVSPRYELSLGGAGSLVLLADYTHTSSQWNDTERTLTLLRPATDILNASATYKARNGVWEVTAGGTNLTSERFLTSGGTQQNGAGIIFGTPNRPAEWYLRCGVKF
jgi:iron complex outermembrane receptor protein